MKYFVGIGQYRLDMKHCRSLKEKRQHVRRIADRFSRAANVAAGEVGDNDYWKSCTMAVVYLSSSCEVVRRSLDQARQKIESTGVEVIGEEQWVINPYDLKEPESCREDRIE